MTDETGAKEPFYRMAGLGSTAIKERADRIEEKFQREITEVLVPTITLNDLLERSAITKIDFLSMDIEGGEPPALAGFDIELFRPELVGIEAAPENRDALLEYFDQHGYRRIDAYLKRDPRNWFFTCKVEAMCVAQPKAAPKARQ